MTQHAELAQDELTGLLNRSAALQAVHDFMQAATADHPLSVALLDVDRFAAFDYEHGLEVGDALLCALACTVAPVLMVMMAIERIGSSLAAQTGMVGPMSTLALGAIFLGESLNLWIGVGTLLVLSGVYLFSKYGAN